MNAKAQSVIYIIDDDVGSQTMLQRLLKPLSALTNAFLTAEEFLQHPFTHIGACLITEVQLPGMSGLELMKHLRERHIHLPTIVLAKDSDVPTAVRAMQYGALDFLNKPILERHLYQQVRQALQNDPK